MKVKRTDRPMIPEHKQKKEFISTILSEIFLICKEDQNLDDKNLESKDSKKVITELKKRIAKQNGLLKKSTKLKGELLNKVEILNNQNLRVRTQLLEGLGSDI